MYSRRHILPSRYLSDVAPNKEGRVQPLHYEGAKAKSTIKFSSPRAECTDSREQPRTELMGRIQAGSGALASYRLGAHPLSPGRPLMRCERVTLMVSELLGSVWFGVSTYVARQSLAL